MKMSATSYRDAPWPWGARLCTAKLGSARQGRPGEKMVQSLTKVCSMRAFLSAFLKQCKSQDLDVRLRMMRVRESVAATDTAGAQLGTNRPTWAPAATGFEADLWTVTQASSHFCLCLTIST